MRSIFAHLKRLVLPGGASPTTDRIVIDATGIKIYKGSKLVGSWNQASFGIGADLSLASSRVVIVPAANSTQPTVIFLDAPDHSTLGDVISGQLFTDLTGADETPYMGISGPRINSETGAPRIDLIGSHPTSGIARHINIASSAGVDAEDAYTDFPLDASKTTDVRIGNVSIPRGRIARQVFTADSVGYTADGATDMFLNNVPVVAGRLYEIHLHSKYLMSAAGGWSVGCHVNGTRIGEFDFANEAAGTTKMFHGIVEWIPGATASTDDITVELDEFAGASTLTLQASGDSPRWLTLKDTGK